MDANGKCRRREGCCAACVHVRLIVLMYPLISLWPAKWLDQSYVASVLTKAMHNRISKQIQAMCMRWPKLVKAVLIRSLVLAGKGCSTSLFPIIVKPVLRPAFFISATT